MCTAIINRHIRCTVVSCIVVSDVSLKGTFHNFFFHRASPPPIAPPLSTDPSLTAYWLAGWSLYLIDWLID